MGKDGPSVGKDGPSSGADALSVGKDRRFAGKDRRFAGKDGPSAGADALSVGKVTLSAVPDGLTAGAVDLSVNTGRWFFLPGHTSLISHVPSAGTGRSFGHQIPSLGNLGRLRVRVTAGQD